MPDLFLLVAARLLTAAPWLVFVTAGMAQMAGRNTRSGSPAIFPPDENPQFFPPGAFDARHERRDGNGDVQLHMECRRPDGKGDHAFGRHLHDQFYL